MNKIIMLAVALFMWFAVSVSAQPEDSGDAKGLFSSNNPITRLLLDTFFLPMELLAPNMPTVEPSMTEREKRIYNMEEMPITLERDITLLATKETGQVAYFWSEKNESWIEPDHDIKVYLQERYDKKDELIKKADHHRRLKSLRDRLKELGSSGMGAKRESRSQ